MPRLRVLYRLSRRQFTASTKIHTGKMIRVADLNFSSEKKPVDFSSGWPNPGLLPPLQLEDAAHQVLSDSDVARESLKYAPDPGYMPLRQEIGKWLTKFYLPKDLITEERICITGGASQNLACVLQTFTDPIYTRGVFMVAPTYFLACRIFDDSAFAGRLKSVPEDEEGINLDHLERQLAHHEQKAVEQGNNEPKLKTKYPWRKTYKYVIYCVPTFANPSGRLMSLQRREGLVRIARKYDALILTDDVYDMLLWSTEAQAEKALTLTASLPRIVDVDRYLDGGPTTEWGNAMSNGSFSKIIAPGCRTGWGEATPKLTWALSQCGSSRSGGAPSALVASMIHRMITRGKLDQHIQEVLLPAYEKRYSALMTAIEEHLVPLGVTVPQPDNAVAGGYFVWLNLPSSLNGEKVAQQALEMESVLVIAGPRFRVQGDEDNEDTKFNNNIRLCFSYVEFEELEEGVKRLANVIKSGLRTE